MENFSTMDRIYFFLSRNRMKVLVIFAIISSVLVTLNAVLSCINISDQLRAIADSWVAENSKFFASLGTSEDKFVKTGSFIFSIVNFYSIVPVLLLAVGLGMLFSGAKHQNYDKCHKAFKILTVTLILNAIYYFGTLLACFIFLFEFLGGVAFLFLTPIMPLCVLGIMYYAKHYSMLVEATANFEYSPTVVGVHTFVIVVGWIIAVCSFLTFGSWYSYIACAFEAVTTIMIMLYWSEYRENSYFIYHTETNHDDEKVTPIKNYERVDEDEYKDSDDYVNPFDYNNLQ